MLFSQMAGISAGRVSRSDAYEFLQQRKWDTSDIVQLLDRLNADSEGNVDKEALVRAHDAMASKGAWLCISVFVCLYTQSKMFPSVSVCGHMHM